MLFYSVLSLKKFSSKRNLLFRVKIVHVIKLCFHLHKRVKREKHKRRNAP